jgi:hypothetical protein
MFKAVQSTWARYFNDGGVEKRILSRGIALAVVPLLLVVLVTLLVERQANSVSVDGSSRLAAQDLNHLVESLLGASEAEQEGVAKALDGARVFLDRAGRIGFDETRRIHWKAKNQLSDEVSDVSLPTMMAGTTRFTPVEDFSKEAPIVDEVQQLFKMTATVFQRMNEHGDMLRIATTVRKVSGERAIGTFIPVAGADGKPNAVLAAVLQGKSYLGRAFVVNAWFIAAYQPIRDRGGNIVGMIYTGLPETELRDKMARFNARLSTAGKTDIFVLHTAAQAKGLFLLSNDKTLEGHSSWEHKDPKGALYVQEICRRALAAKGGEISEASYWSLPQNGQPSRKMIARFTYFAAWDWVIGVQQPEEDFLATPHRIRRIFRITNWFLPLLCLAAAVAAVKVWHGFVGKLARRIESVIAKLRQNSGNLATAAHSIGEHSRSVATSAQQHMRTTVSQAAASEQTTAATGMVAATAKHNSATAERMRTLSSETENSLNQAMAKLGDVEAAMQSISATSGDVLGIVDSINEISFATNILALNASIEAARAGVAGQTFGYIAGEVRALAGRCAEAADQTKGIVNQSQTDMARGGQMVALLTRTLGPVGKSSQTMHGLATEVSDNSQQQANSLGQVLEAVEEIQRASESSAEAAQKGAHDAAALEKQVGFLVRSVSEIDQAIDILNKEFG